MKRDKDGVLEIFDTKKFRLTMLKSTFCLINYKTEKKYFLQFSTKDMWLLPKSELMASNTIKLYGWLFFYIGYSLE